jgi:hypothetical protein
MQFAALDIDSCSDDGGEGYTTPRYESKSSQQDASSAIEPGLRISTQDGMRALQGDDFWGAFPDPERLVSSLAKEDRELAILRVAEFASRVREKLDEKSKRVRKRRERKTRTWSQPELYSSAELDITSVPSMPEIRSIPARVQREDIVMFDWDDTLFPTWHVVEVVQPCMPADAKFAKLSKDSPFHEGLTAHAELIRGILEIASASAHVHIVTLGARPWVENSSEWFLPDLDMPSLLERHGIKVYYAREHVTPMEKRLAMKEEGVCLNTIAKRNAMKKCLKDVYRDSPTDSSNVIAIGDSPAEMQAIREVMWASDSDTSLCKTVKLLPEPTINILTSQLQVVQSWLAPLLAREGDVSIDMEDNPSTSEVIQSLMAASS